MSDVSTLQQRFMDAAISYCSHKHVFGFPCICDSSYKESEVIVNKQSKSVVVAAINQKTQRIVISYRPTMTWQNWKDNVAYSLVHMPNAPIGAQVHQGFYRYYNSTILKSTACVRRLLRDTRYKSYPIQIVGYSLGAAVAIVSLPGWVEILDTLRDTRGLEVIAYAGPRPGNEMLAEYLASFRVPITRYTNRNDIVSHLPPRSLGFVHVGHEIHEKANKDGKSTFINCDDHFDEDPACSYGTEGSYSARRHMLPFNKFVPLPPFCMD
ncbi:hypothetical protein DSO57_1027265 [Entomophthora muscae]|uniref:Uncharacterized protein n=1 Tax=Entomophthora muscae TaxID=34485 RepID=A0ACC2U090_9FUNG|nr:hypothetical protein DSO57_1027265 [Entomophthora muscae]